MCVRARVYDDARTYARTTNPTIENQIICYSSLDKSRSSTPIHVDQAAYGYRVIMLHNE